MGFWVEISGVNIRNPAYSTCCTSSTVCEKDLRVLYLVLSHYPQKNMRNLKTTWQLASAVPKPHLRSTDKAAVKKHTQVRPKPYPSTVQVRKNIPKYGPSTEKKRTQVLSKYGKKRTQVRPKYGKKRTQVLSKYGKKRTQPSTAQVRKKPYPNRNQTVHRTRTVHPSTDHPLQ